MGKALQRKPAHVEDVTFPLCVLWKVCSRLAPSVVEVQLFVMFQVEHFLPCLLGLLHTMNQRSKNTYLI